MIISHRGNGNEYPENTIEACEKALQAGATALEVDIRYCSDGDMVVFHDAHLKRMLGINKTIWKTPLNEFQHYSFPGFPESVRVPSLETFLEHFKNTVPLNLDLKTWWPLVGQFSRDVVRSIKRVGNLEQLWVSSFNPVLLKTIKLNTERIRTGYLFQRWPIVHKTLDVIWQTDFWHPNHKLLDGTFIARAKHLDKGIFTWTVNLKDDLLQLKDEESIHGIITDNPGEAKKVLES